MSAPEMYPIRNIIPTDISVELPTCMYEMKNIHLSKTQIANRLSNNAGDGNITAQEISLPDLIMIENRQKLLLKQLEDLKQQLLRVKSILKLEQPEKIQCSLPPTVNTTNTTMTTQQLPDILLRVDPKSPPYSLLFVQKLLRNQCQIVLTSHVHSNVAGIDENADIFLRKFNSGNNAQSTAANIRLVWINLEPYQMESCVENSWLFGEVNLLRYLARLIPSARYECEDINEINSILDSIYHFCSAKSTDLNKDLEHFTFNLTKNGGMFLCGNELSIADVAAWSALKQLKDVKLNDSLSKWMNKCESIVCT